MAPTALETKPLDALTADDVHAFVAAKAHEHQTLEFKQSAVDAFKRRRAVAGLANADGGVFVLGIVEKDHVASGLEPFDDCVADAHALNQSLNEIKPPIPGLRIQPVKLESAKGVIVVRVGRSPSRPHAITKEGKGGALLVPVRFGVETKLLDMPAIQEMAREAGSDRNRVRERSTELQGAALERRRVAGEPPYRPLFTVHMCATPASPVKLTDADSLTLQVADVSYDAPGAGDGRVRFPFVRGSWEPMLGGQKMTFRAPDAGCDAAVYSDGSCEITLSGPVSPETWVKKSDEPLLLGWYLGQMTAIALWCEKIRRAADNPDLAFEVATMLTCDYHCVGMFAYPSAGGRLGVLPKQVSKPDPVLIATRDDAQTLLNAALKDFLNIGHKRLEHPVAFDLNPVRADWNLA